MVIDNKPSTIISGSKALQHWKDEIKLGIRYRQMYGKSKKWKAYKNMLRGFWQKGVVPVNIMHAIAASLIPQVYFRNPRVGVNPKRPGLAMHARVWERIDNYLIKELWLKNEMKSGILDCYYAGRGPGIIGYDTEFGFNPSFMVDDEMKTRLGTDASLTNFNKKGDRIEYQDNVKPGMPWYLRCNPEDFVVPWGTRRWEEARWFGFRFMRMVRDMQEDPKYKHTASLKGIYSSKMEGSAEGSPNSKMDLEKESTGRKWVECFQIHDKRSGRVMVLSLDHDKFLRDEFDYLQVEGLPAHVLGFNEDPDHFWWTPDARLIEVQQEEINDIRTMAKKHRKVGLLKGLYDKGALKKEELAKFLDGDPKAFAGIDVGVGGDIRKIIALVQSHVPPDLSVAAREVREDVRETVGFSRNQMGAFEAPSGRRTAHEAEIVRAASMIRIDERRDAMADHLEKIVRSLNQLVAENWTAERVIDIVGDDGARYWIRYTGKEIRGEFDYKINPEESIPEDSRTRKAEAREFLELAMKAPGINMKYLLQQYAGQMDWIDPQLLFPGEGPGRSPEKAMLFNDFNRMQSRGTGASRFPSMGG